MPHIHSQLPVDACLLPIYATTAPPYTLTNLYLYAQLKFPAEPDLSDKVVNLRILLHRYLECLLSRNLVTKQFIK